MNRIEQFVEPSNHTYSYIAVHNVYHNEDTLLAYRFFIEDWLNNNILVDKLKEIYKQNKPTIDNIFTREYEIISSIKQELKKRTHAVQNITKHCAKDRINYQDIAEKFYRITSEN